MTGSTIYGMIMQSVFLVVAVIYLLCVEPFILMIVAAVSIVQFGVPNILKKKEYFSIYAKSLVNEKESLLWLLSSIPVVITLLTRFLQAFS